MFHNKNHCYSVIGEKTRLFGNNIHSILLIPKRVPFNIFLSFILFPYAGFAVVIFLIKPQSKDCCSKDEVLIPEEFCPVQPPRVQRRRFLFWEEIDFYFVGARHTNVFLLTLVICSGRKIPISGQRYFISEKLSSIWIYIYAFF